MLLILKQVYKNACVIKESSRVTGDPVRHFWLTVMVVCLLWMWEWLYQPLGL
jgi:hypothetical protein